MGTVPFPYQFDGIDRLAELDHRALLADPQGLGKTVQALFALKENPHLLPAVVVCPASLKYQWQAEALRHVGLRAEVLDGTRPPRGGLGHAPAPILVINYHYGVLRGWMEHIRSVKPKTVIFDECQHLRNPRSRQSKESRSLARPLPYIMALSGTPLVNKPSELWNILNMIDPRRFPKFLPYAWKYCAPKLIHGRWDYSGACNLGKLHRRLKRTVMIRRTYKEVLPDLPPLSRHVVVLPLSGDGVKELHEAENEFRQFAWGLSGDLAERSRAKALKHLTNTLTLIGRLKLPAVQDWIDEHLESDEHKLAVYGTHHAFADAMRERYKGRCVVVDGRTPKKDRHKAKDQFNDHPHTRLFVGNLIAAGTGLSLQCPTLAFGELGWVPGDHDQAEKRIFGVGRGVPGVPSRAVYLVAAGTIEEKLCRVLQRKSQIVGEVLDGKKADKGLDVLDLLIHELRGEKRS
jgi:SWI/SNF-related matrix-associated actin-dependent regulator of chromatin subfamily A-like protein 1